MSTPKKPRSDSTLKTLPVDRQAAIAEYASAHSLEETVKWLKEDGCTTSRSSLSEFLSWYALRAQLKKNESTVDTLLEDFKSANPNSTPEEVQAVGQAFFTALALQQQDPEVWVATQRLNLDRDSARTKAEFEKQKIKLRQQSEDRAERALKFEINKYLDLAAEKLLDTALRKKADELNASTLSNKERIAEMRKFAFADVEALKQSGKLKIPQS